MTTRGTEKIKSFQKIVWNFYQKNRRVFPWRETTDPYAIMVSEIMLQQTQAERVVPKFTAFMKKFPTPQALAKAPLADVLSMWQGLGYNRRALFLKRSAEEVVSKHSGKIPNTLESLNALPGVGPYTAGAILTFAFNKPCVFIETNIRTVFIHHFFKNTRNKISDEKLLPLIKECLPRIPQLDAVRGASEACDQDVQKYVAGANERSNKGMRQLWNSREWYSALMDYGSHLKSTLPNPSRKSTGHTKQSKFKGSHRELRGQILKYVLTHKKATLSSLQKDIVHQKSSDIHILIEELVSEGLIKKNKKCISVS